MRNSKCEARGARPKARVGRPEPRRTFHATRAAAGITLAALLAACNTVGAKAWNLNELHGESGAHQYRGVLESEFEYFMRHELAGIVLGERAHVAQKSSSGIKNPALECLENLIELADCDPSDPVHAGVQIEWFTRIAVDDPAQLSRERAVLALGRAGERLSAGRPVKLPKEVNAAGAEATSTTLAGVVNAVRPRIEKRAALDATERANLEAACQVVQGLALDVNGARRALRVTTDLMRALRQRTNDVEPVFLLAEELERSCVRQALAHALLDGEPLVRAAAVEASVRCAGNEVLAPILGQLGREPAPVVIVRVLNVVERVGLPSDDAGIDEVERRKRTDLWLANIYGLLLTRPESEVHVAAMLALTKVSGSGIQSLREEDWQAWWRTRASSKDVATEAIPNG